MLAARIGLATGGGTLRLIRLIVVLGMSILHMPVSAQGGTSAHSEAPVIFAVSKMWDAKAKASRGSRPFIDAVALVENGRYVAPPKPADPKKQPATETARFEAEYFA